jgi:tetratricopeptide (TPR) repeat protein
VWVNFGSTMPFRHHSPLRSQFALALVLLAASVVAQETTALLATGDSLMLASKPQRALDVYEQAVKQDGTAQAYLGRAKAHFALNRSDRFLLDVERALGLDSTLAEAHYLRALYALRGQDMPMAEQHAHTAINLTPDGPLRNRSLLIRGLARADLKMHDRAITDLEAAMAGGVEDLEALNVLARLYDSAGRHADALRVLERLTALEPGEVGHWSNRGFELLQLGRHEEALEMVERALSLDKDEPVALSNRAYIRYHMGRYKEATRDVERSLRFYPANAYALRTRALLRLRKGDRTKACEDLTLAKVLANIAEVDALVKEHCASTPAQQRRR